MSDALVFEPVPYRSALKENCTHIIAMRTRADNISVTVRYPTTSYPCGEGEMPHRPCFFAPICRVVLGQNEYDGKAHYESVFRPKTGACFDLVFYAR